MKTLMTLIASLLMSSPFAIDLSYNAQDIQKLLSEAPAGFEALGGVTKRVYNVRKDQHLDYLVGNGITCTNMHDNSEMDFDTIINSRSARLFMWELESLEGEFNVLLASPFRLQDLALCHLLMPSENNDDRRLIINNIPL